MNYGSYHPGALQGKRPALQEASSKLGDLGLEGGVLLAARFNVDGLHVMARPDDVARAHRDAGDVLHSTDAPRGVDTCDNSFGK